MGFIAALAPLAGAGATAVGADAGLSAGLGLLGAGVQAIGSIAAGNAQAAQANYAAQVSRNNQIIAEQNAAYATQAGETAAAQRGLQERAIAGKVAAGLAASGLDVNTGSAVDVRQTQAEVGQTDVNQIRQDAALRAYGYRTQASNFGANAQLERQQAGFDATSGWLKGIGGLLSASPNLPKLFGSNNTADWGDWSPRGAT